MLITGLNKPVNAKKAPDFMLREALLQYLDNHHTQDKAESRRVYYAGTMIEELPEDATEIELSDKVYKAVQSAIEHNGRGYPVVIQVPMMDKFGLSEKDEDDG